MKISPNQIYCLKKHVLWAIFEEDGIVFNTKNRVSYYLNPTGAGIINLLDGKRDVKELIETFSKNFEQPAVSLTKDITIFLENLIERDWIYVNQKPTA